MSSAGIIPRPNRPIIILLDGGCPLCCGVGRMLLVLDRGRGRLRVEDITSAAFDPGRYGLTLDEVMAQIHAILPGGQVIHGVEVLRQALSAVGLGWLAAPTAWPLLRRVADAGYAWFSRNRIRLLGRATQLCHLAQARHQPRVRE